MKKSAPSRSAAPAHPASVFPARGRAWQSWIVGSACALLALWTYRHALGAFFTTDDFQVMEQARGLLPRSTSLWRLLSGRVYFGAATALFGSRPFPYHLVNWLLHGLNAALLFAWVRSRGARIPSAALAAALFGASRLYLGAVYPATGVGELLALSFTLGALLLTRRDGPAFAGGAAALFAAALLCKENVLLLPLLLLLPGPGAGDLRARLRRAAPLLGLGALLLAYLALSHVRSRSLGGDAYAMEFGANLFHNLMTYLTWSFNLKDAVPDGPGLSVTAWHAGLFMAAAVAAGAWLSRRRSGLGPMGALWWLLALLPVLPLTHHSYLYYLYAPMAGLAMWGAGWLEWLGDVLERRPPGAAPAPSRQRTGTREAGRPAASASRAAPPAVPLAGVALGLLALLLAAAHAMVSARLLHERVSEQLEGIPLPRDPYLRKSELARNASADMAAYVAAGGRRAVFLTPAGSDRIFDASTGRLTGGVRGKKTYNLFEASLDHGRALRAFHPELDTVAFVDRWTPQYRDFDILIYSAEGHALSFGRGLAGHKGLVQALIQYRYHEAARQHLETVVPMFPDDPQLRWWYSYVLGKLGDIPGSRVQLEELVRRAPEDTLASRARALLGG